MAALTPEQREARASRISASKTGKKHRPDGKAGGARPITTEAVARRTAAVSAAWAKKTPEEREAWRERCRAIKRGSKGNLDNLAKGWSPEVRAKAIEASLEARRDKPVSEETKAKTSASLKAAYAEGRRTKRDPNE